MREHVLEAYPAADVRVYVIWLPMLSPDARSEVDEGLLDEPRVRQFWDGDRVAGHWFARADLGGLGSVGIVWDAYFLFDRDALWNERLTGLLASGAPVISETERLGSELETLLSAR